MVITLDGGTAYNVVELIDDKLRKVANRLIDCYTQSWALIYRVKRWL